MKKITVMVAAAVIFIATGFAAIYVNDKPVNKNIDLSIYKTASYTAPVYNGTFATLKVMVVSQKGNTKEVVWQHEYKSTELKNFPEANNPMVQKVVVPNVLDDKQTLVVYYQLTYNTGGSKLDFLNTETLSKGATTGKFDIQI